MAVLAGGLGTLVSTAGGMGMSLSAGGMGLLSSAGGMGLLVG